MNNWLVIAPNACITGHKDFVVQVFQGVSFHYHFTKSDLIPSTCKAFIGYTIDSDGPEGQPWLHSVIRR